MNVLEYYEQTFQVAMKDRTFSRLPCDSNCGLDCVHAIQLAYPLWLIAGRASPTSQKMVADAVLDVIQVFWHG